MFNDITTIQQVLELLKAGIDPMTCNLVLKQDGNKVWRAEDNFNHRLLSLFPVQSYKDQEAYITKKNLAPAWTTCALLNNIPDDSKLTVTLTRGGYDMSEQHKTYEEAYMSDAYFAIFEYEDDERDFYIERTFGGDSYIEATTNMVIAYLTQIKEQIEKA